MAERLSLAEDRFSQIMGPPAGERAARLRLMANTTDPTFETDWIDFKLKPKDDNKTSELWAKALSGFANSGGGLVVWGIDARKNSATRKDAACGEEPIANPLAFKTRLIELQRGATNPPLANVQIEVGETAPNEGFVVCCIPEGRFKPYRAEIAGKPQYYIRAGDQFVIPAPALLRTLFYPQSHVVFQIEAILSWRTGVGEALVPDMARMSCDIHVHNQGPATAKDAWISIQTDLNYLDSPTDTAYFRLHEFSQGRMRFEAKQSIHPEVTVPLCRLEWKTPTTTVFGKHNTAVPQVSKIRLIFHFHAEDQAPARADITFDGEQLPIDGREVSKTVTASDA
jgi:hypothetical protein